MYIKQEYKHKDGSFDVDFKPSSPWLNDLTDLIQESGFAEGVSKTAIILCDCHLNACPQWEQLPCYNLALRI